MNREIKFRVWDKTEKIFVEYGFNMLLRIGEALENERFDFSQYTGLKDKNGTEIYEGDILEFEYHSHNSWHNVREQVGFALGIFHIWGSPLTDYNGITVIGNIYEHPELLKETSQ